MFKIPDRQILKKYKLAKIDVRSCFKCKINRTILELKMTSRRHQASMNTFANQKLK